MDEVVNLTKKLVEIPSVSGNESAVLQFIASWLREKQFDDVTLKELFVCGRVAGNKSRKALILCGHIDTVAPGNEAAWTYGPWKAHVQGDRLFGLGSGDMKAGVALEMLVAEQYQQALRDFDVWLVAVADEEVSGAGSAAFVQYFLKTTDYDEVSCMIAEPTDEGTLEIGHRGNRFIKLVFRGEASHASQENSYKLSAIPPSLTFLQDLREIRTKLHATYKDAVMGMPSLTPTRIGHGESYSINKATDVTTISIDIRTTPALDADFGRWINTITKKYRCSWEYEAGYVPSALCAPDARILQVAKAQMGASKEVISHGATDQAFFQEAGINTIVVGPGDFSLAHTCDESVSIKRTKEMYVFYQHVISEL